MTTFYEIGIQWKPLNRETDKREIRNPLHPQIIPPLPHLNILSQFNKLSEEEIVSFVSSAPNKSSVFDLIPTSLVKSSLQILVPILRKIVNKSLSTGDFPSPWKRAIILPKLQKANLDPICSNYRPLSNLSFLSKVAERVASIQVVKMFTKSGLLLLLKLLA